MCRGSLGFHKGLNLASLGLDLTCLLIKSSEKSINILIKILLLLLKTNKPIKINFEKRINMGERA